MTITYSARRARIAVFAVLTFAGSTIPLMAASLTLTPVADNTMYQEDGTLSNGAGESFFAGRTSGTLGTLSRRALLRFDLSSIPAGSVITSATVRLRVTKVPAAFPTTDTNFNLHRVLAQWGEGSSNANPILDGRGAPATTNDATWTNRLHPATAWTTPGGDFVGTASAGVAVLGLNLYDWGSTPALVADVQGWVDDPSVNFGWLLRAQNETPLRTAKEFASRQRAFAASRPQLILEYTLGPNDAPQAEADSYVAFRNTPLVVAAPGVLANDRDINDDTFTAVLVSGADNGTVVLNPNGSFTYTPFTDYTGPDNFTYKANDGAADSNVVRVWINVTPLGSSTSQLTYTRLEQPCRIIDTRLGGGPLSDGVPQNFRVAGATGFEAQGGTAGGCGVPPGEATAAFLNFVAVSPAAAGNLRASAFPNVIPATGSIINYQRLTPGLNVANGLAFPICDESAEDCSAADITVQANGGSTQLVADVLGYFTGFPRDEVRSYAVARRQAGGAGIGAGCTNLSSITVNAPVAGEVDVRASVVIRVPHQGGATVEVLASINNGVALCQGLAELGEAGQSRVDASVPPGTYFPVISIRRTFSVPAGVHTFYLNGFLTSGPNTQTLHSAGLDASFHPN